MERLGHFSVPKVRPRLWVTLGTELISALLRLKIKFAPTDLTVEFLPGSPYEPDDLF